jgi:hypothetical protein
LSGGIIGLTVCGLGVGLWTVWKFQQNASARISVVFGLLYLGIHVIWPIHDARFYVPLLPFLLVWMLAGIQKLFSGSYRKILLAVFFAGLAVSYVQADRRRLSPQTQAAVFPAQTVQWIRDNTLPESLFLTNKTGLVCLYTGRYSTAAVAHPDAKAFLNYIQGYHVTHVAFFYSHLADKARLAVWKQTESWVTQSPDSFALVYANPVEAVRIVRVIPPS